MHYEPQSLISSSVLVASAFLVYAYFTRLAVAAYSYRDNGPSDAPSCKAFLPLDHQPDLARTLPSRSLATNPFPSITAHVSQTSPRTLHRSSCCPPRTSSSDLARVISSRQLAAIQLPWPPFDPFEPSCIANVWAGYEIPRAV